MFTCQERGNRTRRNSRIFGKDLSEKNDFSFMRTRGKPLRPKTDYYDFDFVDDAAMIEKTPLILSFDYPPNDGGISRLSAGLVRTLVDFGQNPLVVTIANDAPSRIPRPTSDHIEIDRRKGFRDWQLFRLIREQNPETPVLATVWNPEATIAIFAASRRVSILAHGNEVMPYSRNLLKSLLRRYVLGRARVVICNSRYTEALVKKVAPNSSTVVVCPAIDTEQFHRSLTQESARAELGLSLNKRVIITVARLDPIKGHETVIRALSKLHISELSQITYLIVGKGEMRERLERLAKNLDVANHVCFAGFVSDADLPKWYAASDLFVLPSIVDPEGRRMEGFGMALAEAQAAGLPVIGTRSGGIPDAVHENEGGWLIEEGDFYALAELLKKLVYDPNELREQGKKGLERIRSDHNWQSYMTRVLSLI